MNTHLNLFNNYKEKENERAKENNLTRAFIITLKNEPQLLRDFFFLVNKEYSWDEVNVSIQDRDIDISGFENVVGLAITSASISASEIEMAVPAGSGSPIPDFLIYNSKTLIIGEVKKHSENPINQLKNQVLFLYKNRVQKERDINIKYKALTWTDILADLIIPYQNFNRLNHSKTIWPSEFKEYIATHFSDWLPVPTLDVVSFTENESVTSQLIQKRLHTIQSLTRYGAPEYWVGGRMTMPINLRWATEAQVKLEKYHNKDYICVTIWPADTKAQGNLIFSRNLEWIFEEKLSTTYGTFELVITPYIKFSHVMGKYIGSVEFHDNIEFGKKFHNKENFHALAGTWYRERWEELTKILDLRLGREIDWRTEVDWLENFAESGRNFVFISMGLMCDVYIPFTLFQALDKADPSGKKSASLLEETIKSFQGLVERKD